MTAGLLAAAVLPLVATTSRPDPVVAQTPETLPHIFDANAAGLIANRRPANVGFLGVSDGVVRIEDSREATAGADYGFVTQPDPNTMQQILNPARWGASQSGEIVDTAVGFLTNYASPELVVLRGASGRWTDRGVSPQPMRLTWHGEQRNGFGQVANIDLGPAGVNVPSDEVPVGVEIVNNTDDSRYLMLATDRALYALSVEPTGTQGAITRLLHTKRYPANQRVLGIHHNPQWAASAAEQYDLPGFQQSAVAVLLADDSQKSLRVDLTRVWLGANGPGFTSYQFVIGTVPNGYSGTATGGDVRFGLSQLAVPGVVNQLPITVRQELRVDVNLTTSAAGVRSTRQYAGRTTRGGEAGDGADAFPVLALVSVTNSTCASPATGFDAAYFRASTAIDVFSVSSGRLLEASVMCASPGAGGSVVLGGYEQRFTASWGIRRIPRSVIDEPSNGVAVQPQIALSFPCLEQLRFQVRLHNPTQSGDMSPSSLRTSLNADATFMRNTTDWRSTYRCSAFPAGTGAGDGNFTHLLAGNVQATVSVPTAASADRLGPRSAATTTRLVTRSLEVPPVELDELGIPIALPGESSWRPFEARSNLPAAGGDPLGVSPGLFLSRLPSTDVVELVRLTGQSANCARYPRKPDGTPGDRIGTSPPCVAKEAHGGPIPIAVMQAPPYVKGSGQESQLTPEFANGTSATQESSRFTSTAVGGELEVSWGVEVGDPKVVAIEVEATASVGYERENESSTSNALTISKITGYGGAIETDTVVTNKVRYAEYTGYVVEDSVGIATNQSTVIRIPIGSVVTSQTVRDLLMDDETAKWWGGDGPFALGLRTILSHVPGMPGTYLGTRADSTPDQELSGYCIGDLDTEQGFREIRKGDPAVANPFVSAPRTIEALPQILTGAWGAAQAGNDVTTQRSNIEFGRENSESFLESNSISASVSLGMKVTAMGTSGGIRGTVTAGGSWGASLSSSLGTDTAFSGSVGSIPDPDLTDEEFGWRMFVCKKEIAPGVPVWVQGYQVRGYKGIYQSRGAKDPEELGPVSITSPTQSRSVDTTPTLTWTQPVGTVQDYAVEVEAVGRFDARTFTAPVVDGTGAQLVEWPAVSRRADTTSFTVPDGEALLPNQLYRWRAVSNNFFHRSEESPWEYFVTEGGAAPTTATLSGTVTRAGEPVRGAQVRIFAPSAPSPVRYVATDAAGNWTVPGLPPGAYQALAVPPSRRDLRRWFATAGAGAARPDALTLSVRAGEVRSGILINLRARS